MKWLIVIFSLVKPFFSTGSEHSINPIAELREMLRENAAKIVILFASASALATIFAGGIVIMAVDIGAQYDQNAYVYFSSMITMGLVLTLLPLVVGGIALKAYTTENRKVKQRETLVNVGTSHPLQDALALLIHDFVKEREMRRSEERVQESQHTPTHTRAHADSKMTTEDNRH